MHRVSQWSTVKWITCILFYSIQVRWGQWLTATDSKLQARRLVPVRWSQAVLTKLSTLLFWESFSFFRVVMAGCTSFLEKKRSLPRLIVEASTKKKNPIIKVLFDGNILPFSSRMTSMVCKKTKSVFTRTKTLFMVNVKLTIVFPGLTATRAVFGHTTRQVR